MKKTIEYIIAFAILSIISTTCSSDTTDDINQERGGKQQMTFTATQETSDAFTRTSISGKTINWTAGDKITLWDGTNKNEFTATPGTPATTATLTGTALSSGSFTAVYPHSVGSNCSISGIGISGIEIPKNQTATENSYDPAAAIMTAYTTNDELAFKNACSFLKLTTSAAYTKIVVSVTTGYIAGTFSVSDATSPTLTCTTGMPMIALKPASGTTIAAGTYYIAIAPGTFGGLKIDCYTDDANYIERVKTAEVTFARNKVYDMGSTESGWTAYTDTHECVDLGLSVKWATCDVGASTFSESGNHYAWGETVPKSDYSWDTYKYGTSSSSLTKYNSTDKKTTLELCDDAANANWGGSWRMPTQAEIQELMDYAKWDNVNWKGYDVKGKKEGYTTNCIKFRGGSGLLKGKSSFNSGTSYCLSSSLYGIGSEHVYSLYVNGSSFGWSDYCYYRIYGNGIRPVCP